MSEQRSDGWHQARAGRITASRFNDVIALTRAGKPTGERVRYMRELAFERLADVPLHQVGSKSMAWGTDVESFAREAYELETGLIVEQAEFIQHPRYPFLGASPDGLCGADGGIEMKCPHDEGVHIATWLDGMPLEHTPQVQGAMYVTGRSWWDFVSYDPRQAERFRLYRQRIVRNDSYISELAGALLQFEAELQQMLAALEKRAA